jgi:hypothetical protein
MFKYKNEKRAKTPKKGKAELWFFSTALLLIEIYLPTNFMLIYLMVLELCPAQSSKRKNVSC